jgi:hypothetical protein
VLAVPVLILAQLSEYTRPGFWYGCLALVGVYLIFILAAALLEERPTRPNAGTVPVKSGTPIDTYHAAMNDRATAAGFLYGGTFCHRKHNVIVSFWISPDRRTLIETGAGTILGRRVRQTDLFSRIGEDLVLVTADHYGDFDPSRLLRCACHFNGSLDDLLKLHRQRLESSDAPPRQFDEPGPVEALNEIYAQRARRLIRAGRAKWVDLGENFWSFTLIGSLCVGGNFFPQLASAFLRFWRRWRPRPGDFQGSRVLDPSGYPPADRTASARR